ncbi:hypothetical protein BDR07DRAFT_1377734 [Suillus spraguei]|nr:hypothetical protein BDR07DRAFT_1377734 [Suillus spraguei]
MQSSSTRLAMLQSSVTHSQHRNATQMRRSTATHYPMLFLSTIELGAAFTWCAGRDGQPKTYYPPPTAPPEPVGSSVAPFQRRERILFYNKHEPCYKFTNSSSHDVVYAGLLGTGDIELVEVKLGDYGDFF